MARKKFGFVDGAIPKPSTNSGDFEDWMCNNALVISWIKLTVEASVRTTLHTVDVASDLWELIRKRFAVKNAAKIGKVKTELAMAQQNGRTVESYFGYMNQLWATLSDYRRPKTCRCGRCTCNLTAEIEKEREEDRVNEFLRGLDESYAQIRSTLLSRVPFPCLDDAYLAVTQEEDSRGVSVMRESQTEGVSFATRALTRPVSNNEKTYGRVVCKTCGRAGHTSERCYSVIGYPEWWGDRPKYKNTKQTQDRVGLSQRNKPTGAAHAVTINTSGPSHVAAATVSENDKVGLVGLSDA